MYNFLPSCHSPNFRSKSCFQTREAKCYNYTEEHTKLQFCVSKSLRFPISHGKATTDPELCRILGSHSSVYDITPCSALDVIWHPRDISSQCSWSKNKTSKEPPWKVSEAYCLLYANFLLGLLFSHEDGGRHVAPKCVLAFEGIHGVISQKINLLEPELNGKQSYLGS
jgi:hypothetical protein